MTATTKRPRRAAMLSIASQDQATESSEAFDMRDQAEAAREAIERRAALLRRLTYLEGNHAPDWEGEREQALIADATVEILDGIRQSAAELYGITEALYAKTKKVVAA